MATTDIVVWLIVQAYPVSSPASFLGFYTVNFRYFCCKDVVVSDVLAGKAERNFVHKFSRIANFRFRQLMQKCMYIMTEEHKNPTNVNSNFKKISPSGTLAISV